MLLSSLNVILVLREDSITSRMAWKRGFPIHLNLNLLKQQMEPVKAYLNRKECQTLEELAKIEGDVVAIVMEGLYIRERILGKENAELLYQIIDVAFCYLRNNDLSTHVSLRRHAMKIAQSLINVSSNNDLHFTLVSSYMRLLDRTGHLEQKDVLELLEQIVLRV